MVSFCGSDANQARHKYLGKDSLQKDKFAFLAPTQHLSDLLNRIFQILIVIQSKTTPLPCIYPRFSRHRLLANSFRHSALIPRRKCPLSLGVSSPISQVLSFHICLKPAPPIPPHLSSSVQVDVAHPRVCMSSLRQAVKERSMSRGGRHWRRASRARALSDSRR